MRFLERREIPVMTKAYVKPRPIRVVYLVEETEHWQSMLDSIFGESFSRWGGRFSLIVPCSAGVIRPQYLQWLRAHDPDVIYSYVELDDTYVERLHETFYPAFLVKHRFFRNEREAHDFHPRLPVSALHALSVTPLASSGSALAPSQPVPLIDCHLGFRPSLFMRETFGFYSRTSGAWPLPHDLAPYVKALTIVPESIQNDPRLVPRIVTDIVSTEIEMLDSIRKQRNLLGMAQLSSFLTPRLEFRTGWTNQVNLVIGDSFTDRVLFWNARAHQAVFLDKSIVTLKVEESDVEDAARFDAIVGIIRDRIHVSYGNSSNSTIVIRSASLPEHRLRAVQEKFRAADRWNLYSSQTIRSVDECVPDEISLTNAGRHIEPGAPFQPADWHEVNFSGDAFRPPKIAPRHIRDVGQLPGSIQGAWAFDLDLERTIDYSRFQNVRHHWRFPRRLRLASAFVSGYGLGGRTGTPCVPRVTESGLLSLFATKDGEVPELAAPSDENAFQHALCGIRDWLPFDYGRGPLPNSLAYEMRPSDKGRYLTALLRLAGGVHGARRIFLNGFWLQEFERLGASTKAGDDRMPTLVQTLKKRLKAGEISTEEQWERIGKVVAQEARQVRLAARYLRFDHLVDRFETFRNAFWAVHQPGTPREEWDQDEKESLGESVRYLCSQEILHQGHEWHCPRCKYNNWLSIDALGRTMTCEVCNTTAPAPVAEAWRFKLNAFVLEGLRDHGLLANLWCLDRLSEHADSSFYFLEPHELFLTTDSAMRGRSDAEFDLIAVANGRVHLCEAKTSDRDVDLAKFAQTVRQLRPDVATLAIMEAASPAVLRRQADLEQLLTGTDIAVEVLTLRDRDIGDDPHLPTGRSFSVKLL
jgi:hypothetical protein